MATEPQWFNNSKVRVGDNVRTPWGTTAFSAAPYYSTAAFTGDEVFLAEISIFNAAADIGGALSISGKSYQYGVDGAHYTLLAADLAATVTAASLTYGGWIVWETVSTRLVFWTINEQGVLTRTVGSPIKVDWKPDSSPGTGAPPVDPLATQGARSILAFLYSQMAKSDPLTKRVVAGHHLVSPWEDLPLGALDTPTNNSGGGENARQAALSQAQLDFFLVEAELWNGPHKRECYDWMADKYDAGYIPMGTLHLQNPVNNGNWDDDTLGAAVDFAVLTNPSSSLFNTWMVNYVDKIALEIKRIQDTRGTAFILRGPSIEAVAVPSWFGRYNPSLDIRAGGNPALHGLWFDQFVERLWAYGCHNFIVAYHTHEFDPYGWEVNLFTANQGLSPRTFSTSGGAGAGTGGGSYYGDRITGWEAFSPSPDHFDLCTVSCYWSPGSMTGKVANLVGIHEKLTPNAPLIIGEMGSGNPGGGNTLDYDVATTGFRTKLRDVYVPSSNPNAKGNNSGLNPFCVGFSNWFQTWRIGSSSTINWQSALADPVMLGKGEGVARP